MTLDELELVCQQAARDLLGGQTRPIAPAVVLPLPSATQVTSLPDFPPDDDTRTQLLARFAADRMRPADAPCYGFVAEGVTAGDGRQVDVVVVVYGARGHHPRITAAPVEGDELGDFGDAEDLAPSAMPYLAPLQRAADAAGAPGG